MRPQLPERKTDTESTAKDVVAFLDLMDGLGVHIWLEGGWAVDACLGRQTRPHSDLDIVLEKRDLARVVEALLALGYADVPRPDSRPWNFVMGDGRGHAVDFHVIELGPSGDGTSGESGEVYPAAALTGRGSVAGLSVDCITPEWLVRWHTGYELHIKDWQDVSALCERFGIQLPTEYERLGPA